MFIFIQCKILFSYLNSSRFYVKIYKIKVRTIKKLKIFQNIQYVQIFFKNTIHQVYIFSHIKLPAFFLSLSICMCVLSLTLKLSFNLFCSLKQMNLIKYLTTHLGLNSL